MAGWPWRRSRSDDEPDSQPTEDRVDPRLILGPMLRHVDETSAVVWVEIAAAGEVAVCAGQRRWAAHTFTAHGHHYGVVDVDGLSPGASLAYTVEVDGEQVWPPPASAHPPSRIRTLRFDEPLTLAYGSCRTSISHDAAGNRKHGVDALRAMSRRMMSQPEGQWPDLVLFLGDQVYADETSDAMQEFIASRRDPSEPPGEELRDFEEYAHLYRLAWSDSVNRWLLSTLPSAMIFDDHDIRDDWNTSARWRAEIVRQPWWHDRIVGGLASYWIYQHLGNLSPRERADDPIWAHITTVGDREDVGEFLDRFAERADTKPDSYRWSFVRDLGGTRLLVVDSRAARVLTEDTRQMVDDAEMAWIDGLLRGDRDQVLFATSLPFLLPEGLHHLEAWDEAISKGAWGKRGSAMGEKLRQGADLEHWAAFEESFKRVCEMVREVACGQRGAAPANVLFLSGDVHHSYVAEVDLPSASGRILQAVCSPIRNPLPRPMRFAYAVTAYGIARPVGRVAARSARVPEPPLRWHVTKGPWFDNCIATLRIERRHLDLRWEKPCLPDGNDSRPELEIVADFALSDPELSRT